MARRLPQERHNLAAEPEAAERIERLALAIAAAGEGAYVSGSLDAQTLAERYEAIDPAQAWANFSGPCYRRKAGLHAL